MPPRIKDTLTSVNIHSDFSQLTYGDLSPSAVGDPQITVLEMDDTFGSFQVRYELQAEGDDTRMRELCGGGVLLPAVVKPAFLSDGL